MRYSAIAHLFFFTVLGLSRAAHAENADWVAVLGCSTTSNSFLVRFGTHYGYDPPEKNDLIAVPALEKRWAAMKFAAKSECMLPDGKHISVSEDGGPAYPFGSGGANPDAYFILKIDGTNVYYNQMFWAGYRVQQMAMGAVLYRDGSIQECPDPTSTVDRNGDAIAAPRSKCVDASNRLQGNGLTDEEKNEVNKDKVRDELEAALTPSCRTLRDGVEAALGKHDVPTYKDFGYRDLGKTPSGNLSELDIDINNDGASDRVFRLGSDNSDDCIVCGGQYFYGSYLYAFTGSQDGINPFLDFIHANNDKAKGGEPRIAELEHWGGTLISLSQAGSKTRYIQDGSSARYVFTLPFVADGTTYIYSWEGNSDKIPVALISKMSPDNTIETLCKFPRAS